MPMPPALMWAAHRFMSPLNRHLTKSGNLAATLPSFMPCASGSSKTLLPPSPWKAPAVIGRPFLLQDYGLAPILVNGKFTKNVQGRKTDVLDCQWIQRLHTLGLLEGSFIPDEATEKLRQYCRHRLTLLQNATDYIQKMQKALRLTNIRLDVAVSDITARSGTRIIEAILRGERDPHVLASLAEGRVRKPKAEIAEALTGEGREEYLFELRQSYELYRYLREKVKACDQQIENLLLQALEQKEKQLGTSRAAYTGKQKKRNKNDPRPDVQALFYQLSGGIDLAAIDGVGPNTLLTLLTETGLDLKAFPSARHFCSWLRLAPNNKITGKKVISSKTVSGRNRLAEALRHAANAIGNLKEGRCTSFSNALPTVKAGLRPFTPRPESWPSLSGTCSPTSRLINRQTQTNTWARSE